MTSLEWYMLCVILGLVVIILSVLWRAGGTESKPSARWRIINTPDNRWAVYHKGLITRIWWKKKSLIYRSAAEAYIQRVTSNPLKYDSKGKPIE